MIGDIHHRITPPCHEWISFIKEASVILSLLDLSRLVKKKLKWLVSNSAAAITWLPQALSSRV